MPLTSQDARMLRVGEILHYTGPSARYPFGHPCTPSSTGPRGGHIAGNAIRVKVTSVKTWKTRPAEIVVRAKYGMYGYESYDHYDFDSGYLHRETECPADQS